ncbi:MAG: adenylate kinase family protein [Candidatus Bathyarchaeota archaeon]|nr:adenylate kinase family protein [Candidatus Bathyarchaeota archaeon]
MPMVKRVVLVTGTPCVGKSSVACLLAEKFNALYINLTELALRENLVLGRDEKRDTMVVDEDRMKRIISKIVESCAEQTVIVDGHYAANVVPKKFATHVFVLRRDPVELRRFMEKAGFTGNKLWENLAAEILDVCLVEALKVYGNEKVCEINVSGKSVEDVAAEIIEVLNGSRKCYVGVVDWLGKLEREGLLEEYLRI